MKYMGIIAGAFDCIHPGYIKAFKEMKEHCELLVVCLHSDPSIENPEKLKPVLTVEERIEILESIKYVDDIITYETEKDLFGILKRINPDVRFLGNDYVPGSKPITGAELNIPIFFLDRRHGWSSTKYKNLLCASLKEKA